MPGRQRLGVGVVAAGDADLRPWAQVGECGQVGVPLHATAMIVSTALSARASRSAATAALAAVRIAVTDAPSMIALGVPLFNTSTSAWCEGTSVP